MYKKRIIALTVCLSMILTSMSFGQGLIEATQSGIKTVREGPVNRIAERIEAHHLKNNFTPVSLFKCAEQEHLIESHKDYVEDAVYLELDDEALLQFNKTRRDYLELDIPVSKGKSFQVELIEVDILSADFKMTDQDDNVIYSDDFPGVFYWGIVKGDYNSLVSLSVFDDHVEGLISDDYGNYIIGKTKDIPDSYVLYNDKNLKVNNNFTCLYL